MLYGAFTKTIPFPHAQNGQQSWHLGGLGRRREEVLYHAVALGRGAGHWPHQEIPSPDVKFWMAALLVQSLPYVAALLMALLSAMPRARRRARP